MLKFSRLRKTATLASFLLSSVILYSPWVHSNVHYLPRSIEDYGGNTKEDPIIKVHGATLAYANYSALKRDFPFLAEQSDTQIDQWLLEQFAWISRAQLSLNGIRQTPIPTEDINNPIFTKTSYRPQSWGRAAVVPIYSTHTTQSHLPQKQEPELQGLVDIKGIGLPAWSPKLETQTQDYQVARGDLESINKLRVRPYSDGLATLGEAIAEITRTEALQKAFDIHNVQNNDILETVENYFIISFPFEILRDGDHRDRAALIGRQAHVGRRYFPTPDQHPEIYIDPHGYCQSDYLLDAVDMGGVFPTFESIQKDFLTPAQIELFKLSKDNASADQIHFNPQESLEWKYAYETAAAYLRGEGRGVITQHIQTMISGLMPQWLSIQNALSKINHRIIPRIRYVSFITFPKLKRILDIQNEYSMERLQKIEADSPDHLFDILLDGRGQSSP